MKWYQSLLKTYMNLSKVKLLDEVLRKKCFIFLWRYQVFKKHPSTNKHFYGLPFANYFIDRWYAKIVVDSLKMISDSWHWCSSNIPFHWVWVWPSDLLLTNNSVQKPQVSLLRWNFKRTLSAILDTLSCSYSLRALSLS